MRLAMAALTLLFTGPLSAPAQTHSSPAAADLPAGIAQLREGDLEGSVATLTRVIRDLSTNPARVKELAQAHLHLGIAYAQLDDEKAARASFKEALRLDPAVRPEPSLSSAKVSRVFEDVSRLLSAPPSPVPSAAAAPSAPDVLACNALATATAAAAFEEYLRQFPEGACAGFARVKLAALPAPAPSPSAPVQAPPPRELYSQAYADFARGNLDLAIQEFGVYLKAYPDTEFSDNAMYWIGECWLAKEDYAKAATVLSETIDKYPYSERLPDTRVKYAMALEQLGLTDRAAMEYQAVLANHPGTPAAKAAQERLAKKRKRTR